MNHEKDQSTIETLITAIGEVAAPLGLTEATTDHLHTNIMTTDPVDRTDVTRVMTLQVLALNITQPKLIPVLPSGVTNATSSITLQHIALL